MVMEVAPTKLSVAMVDEPEALVPATVGSDVIGVVLFAVNTPVANFRVMFAGVFSAVESSCFAFLIKLLMAKYHTRFKTIVCVLFLHTISLCILHFFTRQSCAI